MREFVRRLRNLVASNRTLLSVRTGQRRQPVRLELWSLEDRVLPAASSLGTVSGVVVIGGNVGQHIGIQGVDVTLTGQSNQGDNVDVSATTDANGDFTLRSVEAGTYQLSAIPGASFISGDVVSAVTVVAGQNTVQDLAIGGLAPGSISLRDFLSSTTTADYPYESAGSTANSPPVVSTPIANVTMATNSSQTIDLAANFSDPDITGSVVQFNTSDGNMDVDLFDQQAPQTVANFLDYVLNDRYSSTIFHRLDTSAEVLQGGGFGLQAAPGGGFTFPEVATANDPTLQNEFNPDLPDTEGTIAMAKLGGAPNSATSQFFFNLADNSSDFGASNDGGYAVFGAIASDPTSQAVFEALQSTTVKNESATNSAFSTLPLNNYTGTNFPKDTTESNYLVINSVSLLQQNDSLTYSVVSDSDPGVATVQFVDGHPEVLSIKSGSQGGSTTITVQATDQFGASVQDSFQVNVVPLSITSVTNPVNSSNASNTSVSGAADAGAKITVTATDGTKTSTAVQTTANASGSWKATGINVSSLADGTITYTATTTDAAGATVSASETATKNTSVPDVTITTVTNPINSTNDTDTSASGATEVGDTVTVRASDGVTTTGPVQGTVNSSGDWTATGINVSSLSDGTITYTATATDSSGNEASATKTSTKDTVAPAIAITTVTNPINATNETNTSASGTTAVGATVSVTATDGTTTTAPVQATVDGSGNWTATGINVSGLTDGTITYKATATATSGNTASTTKTSTKGTVAPAITITSVTNPVNSSNQSSVAAAGTTSPGASVVVTVTDGTTTTAPVQATVDNNGNWMVSGIDVSSLANGTITYQATATDSFGNTAMTSMTATKGP